MEPNDIEIGARYSNPIFPGTIYLGIGAPPECVNSQLEDKKFLVIIEGTHDSVGYVVSRSAHTLNNRLWSQFQKIS